MPFRSGFVSIIGRPNAGKSTLLNALVGEKLAIVTHKPQTTRNRITGIVNVKKQGRRQPGQIVFVDTPGVHKPTDALNKRMMKEVEDALVGCDVLLLIIDVSQKFGTGDEFVLELVKRTGSKSFLILNKIDLIEKGKLPARAIPPSPMLAERKEQVAQLLQTWSASLADSIAAENFFLDRSREDWQQLIAERMSAVGKIQSIGPIVPENQLRGTFQVMGETGAIDVWFSLSPEKVLSTDSTIARPSVDLGASKRVRIDFAATTIEAHPYNVVGMLEGSDPVLKNEWISLAAHLDGAVPANASVPGNGLPDQYNAADDNASGSAGNMAVVRALVAAPRAKRSILLIWDSGEEVGLWGTRTIAYGAWSDKLVLHVSNDMIGRSRPNNSPKVLTLSSADTIYVTGPKLLSTRIESALQRASTEFPFIALDRRYEDVSSEYYYPRTDAGPYLERGIPIMQFFNGEHADYHKPTDDVAKLDIQKITNVSKLSFGALWLAADDAAKLSWDGIVPETLWWVKPRR